VLQACGLLVPNCTTRAPDEHAHTRGLIRRHQALPQIERAAKWFERRVRGAFGEGDRTVGLRDHRTQDVGVERLRQCSQFITGTACVREFEKAEDAYRTGDESRLVDRAPHPASINASGQAPWNWRISARCTRHIPVKATISGCCSHARERRRPFASTTEGVHFSTRIDHAAVQQSRHDGRQLAGHDGEHRLIQTLRPARISHSWISARPCR
jgi:hypothetical protein